MTQNTNRKQLPPIPAFEWEARYQAGDTGWDQGTYHPALDALLSKGWMTGRVLVPGLGKGHDAHRIARSGAQVTGLDFAPSALVAAEQGRVRDDQEFILGDILNPPKELLGQFDWIWEHTCLCALPPSQWQRCLQNYAHLLKPEGKLLGVFYMATCDPGSGPPFKIQPQDLSARLSGLFTRIQTVPIREESLRRKQEESVRLCEKRLP